MKITIDTRTRTINIDTGVVYTSNFTKADFDENKISRRPNGEFAPKGGGGASAKTDTAADGTELNTVDISDSFKKVKCDPNHQQECMEKYLGTLIGQAIGTSTQPLQIRIDERDIPHIVRSNVELSGNQKIRHNAALLELERIIRASKKTDKPGDVDLKHNTGKRTLSRKKKVQEYVYFKTRLQAAKDLFYTIEFSTERNKTGDSNVLNLYNVHVKRA